MADWFAPRWFLDHCCELRKGIEINPELNLSKFALLTFHKKPSIIKCTSDVLRSNLLAPVFVMNACVNWSKLVTIKKKEMNCFLGIGRNSWKLNQHPPVVALGLGAITSFFGRIAPFMCVFHVPVAPAISDDWSYGRHLQVFPDQSVWHKTMGHSRTSQRLLLESLEDHIWVQPTSTTVCLVRIGFILLCRREYFST